MTALMLACANKDEKAAARDEEAAARYKSVAVLLMEATQKAGALDVQVNVVWSVWEGLGRWWGQGRGRGERRVTKSQKGGEGH